MSPRTERRHRRKRRLQWKGAPSGSKRQAWKKFRDDTTAEMVAHFKTVGRVA